MSLILTCKVNALNDSHDPVDQNDTEMLLQEIKVIDNILNVCGRGITAKILLEPSSPEEAD